MPYKLDEAERQLLRPVMENRAVKELLERIFEEEARDWAERAVDESQKIESHPSEVTRLGATSSAMKGVVRVPERSVKRGILS